MREEKLVIRPFEDPQILEYESIQKVKPMSGYLKFYT